MASKYLQECVKTIREAAGMDKISDEQAATLIEDIMGRVKANAVENLGNVEQKVQQIGEELLKENQLDKLLRQRNAYLTVKAVRHIDTFVRKFPTLGEGLRAFNEGTRHLVSGGRLSVDAQTTALFRTHIGELESRLDSIGALPGFRSGDLDHDIAIELWHLNDKNAVNPSGNKQAFLAAKIIRDIQSKMIERENRAGAYINMLDNYIVRQSHDADKIRLAGRMGFKAGSSDASFKAWSQTILPMLDHEKTFGSITDPAEKLKFLKGIHEGLLTGVHGTSGLRSTDEFIGTGALAKKVSNPRVLHFADAESAFKYNQQFGSRTIREGVIQDIRKTAHNIGMMENWGPNPQMTFQHMVRTLKEEARTMPDDVAQMQSFAAAENSFKGIMGEYDRPHDITLHRITRGILAWSTLSKLGSVTLSAIPDKAFFHAAMTYQGMRNMDVFAEQLGLFLPKTAEDTRRMRMLGAAVDGFLGDVSSRFVSNDNPAGMMYRLQQTLFRINGMNWWNDVHKSGAARLMTNWLGEHADLAFDKLPKDLQKTLDLYDIKPKEWDAIRDTSITAEDGHRYVLPEMLSTIPDERLDSILVDNGEVVTEKNRLRLRDKLDSKLQAYIIDQVDDAVITPGSRDRRLAVLNTQAGTAHGLAARLLMQFKSFPIAAFERVIKREIYGHGSNSIGEWLKSDRKGNFRLIQVIAMATIGGYISQMVKDLLAGRTPRRMYDEDGFHGNVLQSAMLAGGGLGIYGNFLFSEYDRSYKNALNVAAGPIVGQVPEVAAMFSDLKSGKSIGKSAEKFTINNAPFINLFYIRPVLDYLILWNIQEMMDPGSVRQYERNVQEKNHQGFWLKPSEALR